MKFKTIKLLEEYIEEYICGLSVSKGPLSRTHKAPAHKKENINYTLITIKNFYSPENIKKLQKVIK